MLKLQPRPSTAPHVAEPRYIATPCERICGEHSIIIMGPRGDARAAIYVVGPDKAAVETTAAEVLAALNQ